MSSTKEITKLPLQNKAAIEYLFRRACHTINAHSPLEMSDPAAVSRVLGDLFQQMQNDEKKWATDLRAAKGWVCDLPEKLGGGAISLTSVNANSNRLQIQGNAKWNLQRPLEVSGAERTDELEKILLKFAQDGNLLEVSSEVDQKSSSTTSASSSSKSRITLMGSTTATAAAMRIFHVKETPESRKHMGELLSFAQQLNMKQNNVMCLM